MGRRFDRNVVCVPVDLVFDSTPGGLQSPARMVDVSEGGLRVQTGPSLICGRRLEVFLVGSREPFARCRVVWSVTHGSAVPSEAGLEILDHIGGANRRFQGHSAPAGDGVVH